ncbi:hypothetical protein QWY79_15170 [Halomonas sabkhae]|uniref:hypothetical protein n=1 Tax=Halomonas sabkhae TaxID=626223 RepID=UPI0025B2CA14|nr:hypothetical protein [Halomonas sabkhae]MDN3526611.1 hypothetical protein [Halomonas sabkhae]
MSQLYLHVGHGKTGSSYIQSSLALSQSILLENGIDYPESSSATRAKKGRITSGNGGMLRSVLSQDYAPASDNVLFSSEVLFHDFIHGKLDDVLEQSGAGRFDSVNILLFIRDLVEHASSSYQQMVKRGGSTVDIEGMFSRYKQPELVSTFIDRCRQHPNVSITILNYSNCKRSVLQSVESWLGLAPATLVTPAIENVNRSMTRSELRVQKGVNGVLGKSGHLVSDQLCNNMPDIKSEKSLPSEDIQRDMLERLKNACDYVDSHADADQRYNDVTLPVDAESLRDDNYTFTGHQIDIVAKGLAGEIKRLRDRQAVAAPAASLEPGALNFSDFSKKLEGKFDRRAADTLRDLALCFESAGDLVSAHHVMNLALKARPAGKLIRKKVAEYSARLQQG